MIYLIVAFVLLIGVIYICYALRSSKDAPAATTTLKEDGASEKKDADDNDNDNFSSQLDKAFGPRPAPGSALDYLARGGVKLMDGQNETAIEDFNAAIQLKPDYAEAYGSRALAKFNLGQYTAAIADHDVAIQTAPDNVVICSANYFGRANAKYQLGQNLAAIADYNAVIQLDPNYTEAYFRRGLINGLLEKEFDAGIKDVNKAMELAEKSGNAELQQKIMVARMELRRLKREKTDD